ELSAAEGERAVQPADGRARRHRESPRGRAAALQRARAGIQHVAPPVPRESHREAVQLQGLSLLRGAGRREGGTARELHEAAVMTELLPWERLLWSGRPWRLVARVAGEHYLLTDFRLVRVTRAGVEEIALDDVGEIQRMETGLDRLLGTSTILV